MKKSLEDIFQTVFDEDTKKLKIKVVVLDDVVFPVGTDSDIAFYLRSTGLTANTALTGVLEGTPVTPAIAANSLIISNLTNDGDLLIAASDGGHSKACLFFDASTPDLTLYNVGGTWTAGATTWTIPAVTLGGAISMAANDLVFTNGRIQSGSWADYIDIRNNADNALGSIRCSAVVMTGSIVMDTSAQAISAPNTDATHIMLRARDTGNAVVEVARLQGAADPYFQASLPLRFYPIATASLPATPVEGMVAYDATVDKLKVYNGADWETITSA